MIAGLPIPAGKPDPTRYPQVRSGRVGRFAYPQNPNTDATYKRKFLPQGM